MDKIDNRNTSNQYDEIKDPNKQVYDNLGTIDFLYYIIVIYSYRKLVRFFLSLIYLKITVSFLQD